MESATILVVEDSRALTTLLSRVLGDHGYSVRSVADGDAGIASALGQPPDLMIVDVGLPRRNGLEVVREVRSRGLDFPVLMLTARSKVSDRVVGLDAGADDYLAKPFDSDELAARVRALLRRASLRSNAAKISVGDVVLDPLQREVVRKKRPIGLTQREFALLEYFMRNAGKTLSRDTILQQVWKQSPVAGDETNIVDVYVAYLRRKLEESGGKPMLHTVRGAGYVFRAPSAVTAKKRR